MILEQGPNPGQGRGRRVYRSRHDRVLMGLGGGLAEYFGLDPTLVRAVLALVLLIAGPLAPVAYVVVALFFPLEPSEGDGDDGTSRR